jgi:hypothetical protein
MFTGRVDERAAQREMTERQTSQVAGEMMYSAVLAKVSEEWPRLPVYWFRPTIEYDKEGYLSAEELKLAHGEPLVHVATIQRS